MMMIFFFFFFHLGCNIRGDIWGVCRVCCHNFFFFTFAFLSSIIFYIYFWENPVIIFCCLYW